MTVRNPADAVLALVVLAIGVSLLMHVLQVADGFPVFEVGAYTWPFVTLAIMIACGLGLLSTALWGRLEETSPPAGNAPVHATASRSVVEQYGPVLLMMLTIAFIWSLPIVGFALAIVVWFPIAVLMLGHVSLRTLLASSVVFYLFTYGVFIAWLGLSLPRGRGVFGQISRALGI